MKRLATPSIGTLLLCLGVMLVSGCDSAKDAPPPPKPNVKVMPAEMREVTPIREFVGRTESSQDIEIKSKIRGNLLTKNFDAGSTVQKGDLLFEIDPEQYQATQRSSKAMVAQAKAAYNTAVMNWQRGESLIKDNYISQADIDNLLSKKLQTEAALESAEANLSNAELELGYTKIHAPFTGRISRAAVFTGDLISADQTVLANLVQMEPVWVNFQLPERVIIDAQRLNSAEGIDANRMSDYPVSLLLPDHSKHDEIGKMDYADNRVDASTGTLAMRAVFPNKKQLIVPGLYVTVVIESAASQQVLLIPQRAVQEDQQGRYVMTVNSEKMVVRKNVTLGQRYGIDWQVDTGLVEGDLIITEGLQKIRAGIEVVYEQDTDIPFTEPNEA